MTTAKRIFYSAAITLGSIVLAATATYLLVDDKTLIGWLARGASSAAGINISYDPQVKLSRTLRPTLSLSNLVLDDPETGYQLDTSSLQLQLSLPRLLSGKLVIPRLWLGDTRVELGTATPSAAAASQPPALPVMPELQDVRVGSLRIVSEGRELRLPSLNVNQLALAFEAETDTLGLTARIDIGDDSVAIEAGVPAFHKGFKARDLGFSASARSAVGNLAAHGHLDFSKPAFVVDGKLSAQASDLKQLPTGIKGLTAPGAVEVQAQLAGTVERLAATNIKLQWQGPAQSSLAISGHIDDLDDLSGVALDVSGRLGESPWLAPVLPDSMGVIRHAELSGRMSGAASRLAVRDLNLAAADANELAVSLRGQLELANLDTAAAAQNLELHLTFQAPTTRAARALLFDDVPELGAVQGEADIHSTTGDPSFENIVVSTRDAAGIEVDLKGRIAAFPLDALKPNRGYDLDASMKAAQLERMGERLGLNLPIDGPLEATYRIEGDTQALRLEQIKLAAGKTNALHLNAEGQLHFGAWDQADPLQMINLGLRAASHDTRLLAKLLHTELPELGALNARARLQTVSNRHQITDFHLQTAKGAPVALALSGTADHVALLPEPLIEDMALTASASTADVSRLNTLFGWQDAIPAIGPAEASARLAGSDQQLSVSDVSVRAGTPDVLLIKADGRLGTLSVSDDWHPRNASLSIKANATGSKAFARVLGYGVPELGPLAASAQLRDKGKTLALESGMLRVGDAWNPAVRADGYISDLLGAAATRWNVVLDLDGQQLAQFADYKQVPELGALKGELQISNSDGSLGIDSLSIGSSGSELLSLTLKGRYGDFGKPQSMSFNGTVNARDLELVGALLDRDWPPIGPFKMETKLSRVVNNLGLNSTITAGKAVMHADLVATLEAQPPLISGKIVARNAFVPSLVTWRTERIAKQRAASGPVFSDQHIPFDWLRKFDLDVSVDVESFDPELSRAASARADIAMSSGQLWLRPATVKYPVGELAVELQIDARHEPRVRFKAHGEDLYPRQMFYMKEVATDSVPDLDIDIDLDLTGNSPRELAAGSRGSLFLEIKNGYMPRDLIDLVFVDIVGWAWSKSTREKYYALDCGVADYSIDQGVVDTNAFLLDGKTLAVSGKGTIDLGKEQIDYVFLPKKKSRFVGKADPVKVTGPLNDPSVSVIPWKSAATTYAPLLFGPFVFAGVTAAEYLSSKVIGNHKESPCLTYEKKRAQPATQQQ